MKTILRNTFVNAFSLFVASQVISGFRIAQGLQVLLIGGFILSLMSLIIRPVLTILTFPLNILTFGAFSFVVNAFILYLLTIFIPQIQITAFVFPGVSVIGFIIPKIAFNLYFAYVIAAFVLSFVTSFVKWLIK